MQQILEYYRQMFVEYLDTGYLPQETAGDCLAEYLKEVLDDPGNRHLCTSDTIWKDLLLASLLEFFGKLLSVFCRMDREREREMQLMDEFLQADIATKRLMWPMIEQDISRLYPQSEVNLKGYIRLMHENRIPKDDIFDALVTEWRQACNDRTKRNKRRLLDSHKQQYRNWAAQAGKEDWMTIKETENVLFRYPQLQEIIRMMGREKAADAEEKDCTVNRDIPILLAHSKSKEEVDGIRTGDDLNAMLPTEAVWLSDASTEHLFYYKFASKQLQLFSSKPPSVKEEKTEREKKTEPRLQEGPMIICIDTSGSMEGRPERIAKSLTMQILQAAKRKGRKCMLITFSVRANMLEMTEPKHWQKVRDFMKKVFTGGTDGEDMLYDVLEALDSENWSMADVLVISDFQFFLPTGTTQARIVKEQQKGTRFYGLQIGRSNSGYGRILNRIWTI